MTTSNTSARDELIEILHQTATADRVKNTHLSHVPVVAAKVAETADAILAAGYVKADHAEYGMDHKHSDLEFTDEYGEPWTDEEDFRAYAEEYGDSMQMVRRHVTAWEPLA
jgi:antirestriction protein